MAYRKFWLINANNERYDLTEQQGNAFLDSPDNLGFSRSLNVLRLGNSEIVNSIETDLNSVTGDLIFYKQTNETKYQNYFDFAQFIRFQPLFLYYLPPNTVYPYYAEVYVLSLGKSEVNYSTGVLSCPVTYKRTTNWLTANEVVVTSDNSILSGGKEYPLDRPYYYMGNSLSNVALTNSGSDEVGMIIEIDGTCVNPQFTIYQNGTQYGVCKLTGTFDYVRINSIETEEEIYLEYNGSTLSNPTSYQDLSVGDGESAVTFVKLKVGASNMVWAFANTFTGSVTIRYRNSYITV